jgi:hypothetical protein
MRDTFLRREAECFRLLREIPPNHEFVLVGGYAVSSYEFPRFSVDLDLVIPEAELEFFRGFVEARGYEHVPDADWVHERHGGRSERYRRKGELPTAVDLMVNSVQSRKTGCAFPYEYVAAHAEVREIRGMGADAWAEALIPEASLLIAMKANPMRPADMRDIVFLCYGRPDPKEVVDHLALCSAKELRPQVEKLLAYLDDEENRDSLKGVFELGDDRVVDRAVENCRFVFEAVAADLGTG